MIFNNGMKQKTKSCEWIAIKERQRQFDNFLPRKLKRLCRVSYPGNQAFAGYDTQGSRPSGDMIQYLAKVCFAGYNTQESVSSGIISAKGLHGWVLLPGYHAWGTNKKVDIFQESEFKKNCIKTFNKGPT